MASQSPGQPDGRGGRRSRAGQAERRVTADKAAYPRTPDGRYFVVRGRLWRCTNPALSPATKERLTKQLMDARRLIAFIKREGREDAELMAARATVDRAKTELGERGPAWWDDNAPDYNRRMAKNTPYASWYSALSDGG